MPVRLKKEIDGFALNRVQMAIIAESWRLVQVSVVAACFLLKLLPLKCDLEPGQAVRL